MAFVNERLTHEQRTEFAEKEIKNPVPHVFGILKPLYWTIDYDNDICLIGAGEYREFPDETYFVFINKSKVICFVAKKHFVSGNSLEWGIFRILDEVQVTEKDMKNITTALSVFQVWGEPGEINTNISVTFSIKEKMRGVVVKPFCNTFG